MDNMKDYLSLNSYRRFGTEIEINAFDGRNRPIGWQDGKLPEGIHYVGHLVKKITNDRVLIHKWGNDHHNNCWIVKPDSSCGMEVCSPVYKGWWGVKQVCRVIEGMAHDPRIKADHRCSLHIHVDVGDMTTENLGAVIGWWLKCEPVFMDAMPALRKRNRYCQYLGATDMFDAEVVLLPEVLIRKLGYCKYYSLNTYHLKNGKRPTIEFRTMDHESCLDPCLAKNWIRLILHFIERAVQYGVPKEYKEDDPWTGYAWLDPKDVWQFLGFDSERYELSPGLVQVRNWFVQRMLVNCLSNLPGILSEKARCLAYTQIQNIALQFETNVLRRYTVDELYSDKFRV